MFIFVKTGQREIQICIGRVLSTLEFELWFCIIKISKVSWQIKVKKKVGILEIIKQQGDRNTNDYKMQFAHFQFPGRQNMLCSACVWCGHSSVCTCRSLAGASGRGALGRTVGVWLLQEVTVEAALTWIQQRHTHTHTHCGCCWMRRMDRRGCKRKYKEEGQNDGGGKGAGY